MTDAEQLRRYLQTGDPSAAEALFAPHQQSLSNYLRGFLPGHHDAEDALQETYYRALRALPNYREETQFRGWLYRIAHNVAISLLRRDQRHKSTPILDELPTPLASARETAANRDDLALLELAIANLPDAEREVLILRLQSDLPFREIVELTGAPLNTVLGRMHNARRRLREVLTESAS